ncbi:dihydrolipoyl dehydrogenase [Pseudactinotalea sp. Z1739]|uniref:dihydrolipoyl dehydrogenase n=1 Tax=Pseudactinotalea sp. Z1739 TaxID=3413028 RepID=UPI003C7B490E
MNDEESVPYDLIVLGAGSGGYAAALRGAQLGLSVAMVEVDRVGGTCLHRGCIPTKALLQSAHVADVVRQGEDFGVLASLQGLDMAVMQHRKRTVVHRMHKGLQSLVSARSIELIPGRGMLTDANTVMVNDAPVRGRHVVVATGSRPASLTGASLSGRVLSSDQALELEWIPSSAIVIGGGVVGVEFASMWRSLGTEVTVVEALPHLLPGEDEDLSKGLRRAFRKRGITVRTEARVEHVDDQGDQVSITLADGTEVTAEVLLVSVGRTPVTAHLGLEDAGVDLVDGFVATDERLRTSREGIYAVGDVVRGAQLAHRAFAHGIFVAEEIAGLRPEPVADDTIPRVTYSDPEVAAVGLTETQARQEHGEESVQTGEFNLAGNARSQIQGVQGLVKLVRVNDGPIVGAHLIGQGVGELIGEAQLMVGWQAYPEDVAPLIHAHPTQNESLGEAALALAGQPLHSNH